MNKIEKKPKPLLVKCMWQAKFLNIKLFTIQEEIVNCYYLSGQHDVCGSLDSIDKRLSASVEIVEFGFGDGVVDVDGGNLKLALLEHAVQVVDTSCGFLTHTLKICNNTSSTYTKEHI
jgi:hypothetical protein